MSSQATLGGAPRLGRVTQPGLRKRTRPSLSLRGTCVCPCKTTSISSGGRSGGMCCRRNFNPPRARSRTNGRSELLSQFPRTTLTRGPIARSSSRIASAQTSPRCQISTASLAISLTFVGRRLCVSARTKMRQTFECVVMLRFELPTREAGKNIGAVMIRTWHPLAINGVHHVSRRVRDVERSLAFYQDVLGFSPKTSFLLDGLRFGIVRNGQ